MIVVPTRDLPVDRSWWRPLAMRASGSHVADMSGVVVEPEWFLGGPDDYMVQPWFSAGAIRFVAVQIGGMHAVFDAAADHLSHTGRSENPYQSHRLATMGVAVESCYLWLDRVADAWSSARPRPVHGADTHGARQSSLSRPGAGPVMWIPEPAPPGCDDGHVVAAHGWRWIRPPAVLIRASAPPPSCFISRRK